MKKIFTLVTFLIALSMLIAACGPAATTAAPTTEAPTQPPVVTTEAPTVAPTEASLCPLTVEPNATITFSGWGDESEQKVYRDTITRFKTVCPDVTVNYVPVPTDFQTKLKAQMAGGTAPDVIYVDDQLMTAFAPSGQLLALDDLMATAKVTREDFIPALLKIFTLDSKTYALPKDWGTLGLIYLPEAFTDAGIAEPTANWTWDDMRTAAKAIAAKGKFAGFCMGADWARFSPFVTSNGGAFASADYKTATLDTPEVKAMATFVDDMFKEKSLGPPR